MIFNGERERREKGVETISHEPCALFQQPSNKYLLNKINIMLYKL
jgi:hypothetical protein